MFYQADDDEDKEAKLAVIDALIGKMMNDDFDKKFSKGEGVVKTTELVTKPVIEEMHEEPEHFEIPDEHNPDVSHNFEFENDQFGHEQSHEGHNHEPDEDCKYEIEEEEHNKKKLPRSFLK